MMLIEEPASGRSQQVAMRWFLSSGRGNGTAAYEVLPKSNVDLIFRSSPSSCEMLLLGPVTERTLVEFDLASDYSGVRFFTDRTPRLADFSPSDLVDRRVELTKVMGQAADALAERLHLLPAQASKHRVMEELVQGGEPLIRDERCRRGAALLEASGGKLRVSELAAELGLSTRSLERLFCSHLGIPPKRLARLIRLREFILTLRAGGFRSLANLAYAHGYTDQAHMIKDIKELTGRLPGRTGFCRAKPLVYPPSGAIRYQ